MKNNSKTISHNYELMRAAMLLTQGAAGRLLYSLTRYAGPKLTPGRWSCDPAVSTLARVVKVNERIIPMVANELEGMGLITVTRRTGAKNVYVLNTDLLMRPTRAILKALSPLGQGDDEMLDWDGQAAERQAKGRAKGLQKLAAAKACKPPVDNSPDPDPQITPQNQDGPDLEISHNRVLDQSGSRSRSLNSHASAEKPPLSKNSLDQDQGKPATSHQRTPYKGPSNGALAMRAATQQLLTAKFEAAKAVIDRFAGVSITKAQTPPELQKAREALTRLHYEATNCRFTGLAAQLGQLLSHNNGFNGGMA